MSAAPPVEGSGKDELSCASSAVGDSVPAIIHAPPPPMPFSFGAQEAVIVLLPPSATVTWRRPRAFCWP